MAQENLTDRVVECMLDDEWQAWLKKHLSAEEWDQHIRSVRTVLKTHDNDVVELVRAIGPNDYISLGYFRLTMRVA